MCGEGDRAGLTRSTCHNYVEKASGSRHAISIVTNGLLEDNSRMLEKGNIKKSSKHYRDICGKVILSNEVKLEQYI